MRILVDESAGTAVVRYLRERGHDVVAASEGSPRADDIALLTWARLEGRLLATNDKDFGELAFRDFHGHAGILLLRLADESAENRVRVVAAVLEGWSERLPGAFTVATERHVRIRSNT